MASGKSLRKIKQIFHPYWLWEDYQHGMYEQPSRVRIDTGDSEEERLEKVIECLGNETICETYMRRVINEWKYACENHLTNPALNKIAWLGQSACCLYAGITEAETRKGWALLTDEQREKANNIAEQVYYDWRYEYGKQ